MFTQASTEYEDCLARTCMAHLRSLKDKPRARLLSLVWIHVCTRIYGPVIGRRTVKLRFGLNGCKLFDTLYVRSNES